MKAEKRKCRRKSNAGPKRWRRAVSTIIRKSASSSSRRRRSSDSIRQKRRHSTGWKWMTKSATQSKRRSSQSLVLILCLDDRRGNVFGRPHVDATAQLTVAHAVKEINAEPDCEPNNEASPCLQWQTQHQNDAKKDTKKGKPRDHRNPEWARTVDLFAP